jgi:threonine dehydratase
MSGGGDRVLDPPTPQDLVDAASRLEGSVVRTPTLEPRALGESLGIRILVKPECFQLGGSFKIRGALNLVMSAQRAAVKSGLAAYSSGNHARAVGLCAQATNTHATVLMPEDAPPEKVIAARKLGVEVVAYDRYRDDRVAMGEALARDRGMLLVPPYDHRDVIAGHATAALELLEDHPELDVLVVPVGGGGLLAGTALAASISSRMPAVVGVEPVAADDAHRSLESGRRVRIDVGRTIADGLQADVLGRVPFAMISELKPQITLVTEEQIVAAMDVAFNESKLVLEPSAATTVAALMAHPELFAGKCVGVIASGGNVSRPRFCSLLKLFDEGVPGREIASLRPAIR